MLSPSLRRAALACAWVLLLAARTGALALTVQIGGGGARFVAVGDEWRYFRGDRAPSSPADAWKEPGFDDESWELGPSGFGYDDDDDATVLDDMEDNYDSVYIRREFTVGSIPGGDLVLSVDFDDGFIACLNGDEIVRENMPSGTVSFDTNASGNHEAGSEESFNLGLATDLLVKGVNVLTIEGHNVSTGSSDFSLIPSLSAGGDGTVTEDGDGWIVGTANLTLIGVTDAPTAVTLLVDGEAATTFDAGDGTWETEVTLAAGTTTIEVEAHDAGGATVDSGSIRIIYVPPENRLSGTLTEDTVLSGAWVIEETLTVPAGVRLTIAAGTTVMLDDSVSLLVEGDLQAVGSASSPIRFTHHGARTTWGRMMFLEAADSRLAHCTVEFSDCAGAHQDYYEPGDRDYHEAIVAIASHLDIESCLFQNLPGVGGDEGDAMAIISDDPQRPGTATATVIDSRFIGIGQGVHTRFSYVRVERCYFTGHHGDNDDVDLWGESDPPPLIISNLFEYPDHDDAINPTKCSAVIVGNIIRGTDDHGLVLRGECSPILINNIVSDCANGGIAIENACDALLVNNTVYDCGRGLRLFDLGRWGPPYRLEPGGGTATVINCIVWNCNSPVTLADSDNTDIDDQGSHLTVINSIIQDGVDGVSISGSDSTLTWGDGSSDRDPLFVDPANGDFRLGPGSAAIDTGRADGAPDDDIDGLPRPCGDGVDMGAHESGDCGEGPRQFRRGEVNGDGITDVSDAIRLLLHLFAGGARPACEKSADVDDSGDVDVTDATRLLLGLFQGGAPPNAPYPICGRDPSDDELGCESFPGC